jgi:pilus assembly protein Flp/PilA
MDGSSQVGKHVHTQAAGPPSRDENAISSVEYGLILGLIVLAMLTALTGFANMTVSTWNDIASRTSNAAGQATAS